MESTGIATSDRAAIEPDDPIEQLDDGHHSTIPLGGLKILPGALAHQIVKRCRPLEAELGELEVGHQPPVNHQTGPYP